MDPQDKFELTRLRVSPRTLRNYNRDLQLFLNWIPEPRSLLKSWDDLDLLVTEYAVFVYRRDGGTRRQAVVDVKAALQHYLPETMGKFPITNRSLEGWAKVRPIQQHPVCPRLVAYGLAHQLMIHGKPEHAVAVLLAFDCYLRAGDLQSIQIHHVTLQLQASDDNTDITPNQEDQDKNQDKNQDFCGALFLPKTKCGLDQSVLIRPYFLGVLLSRLRARRIQESANDCTAPLFNFPIRSLNYSLKRAAQAMDIAGLGVTLHTLRYGGASQDAAERALPYGEIKARGRWHNDKSFQRYLQPGLLFAQLEKVPVETRVKCLRLVNEPGQYFNVPRQGRNSDQI
jgi:integrase